ncbi:WG repeat-containing protein [Lachnospiraceae bacterium OttesenSCG-928-D06]|nr:WG repeat-containing protein [Lachnospiraceae bacterium OttesenSCG-928-D06]
MRIKLKIYFVRISIISFICILLISCANSKDNLENQTSSAIEAASVETIGVFEDVEKLKDVDIMGLVFYLPLDYDYISELENGYAYLLKGVESCLIDEEGNVYMSSSEYEVINGYKDVICVKSMENSKYGLMGADGKIIVDTKYDMPIEFSEDMALVERNGRIGYINLNGELVIESDYSWGCAFSDGMGAVGIDGVYWFINKSGEVKSGPYDFINQEAFIFISAYMEYSDGLTAYFIEDIEGTGVYTKTGYWGYVDKNGKIVIPAQYMFVRPFSEGVAAVQTTEGDWIYIDKTGNKVMDGVPSDFFNGMACIGKTFIDKDGNEIIEIPEGYKVESSIQSGYNNFKSDRYIIVYNEQKGIYALMDFYGKIILESDLIEDMKNFDNNHVSIKVNGKWGVVSIN